MKPEVKVFTKDKPCTKADLWTCFRNSRKTFAAMQVDLAHSIIGKNAPRYMETKEYLVVDKRPDGDYYRLTPLGEQWLTEGIKAYVKNHPAEKDTIGFLPEAVRGRTRQMGILDQNAGFPDDPPVTGRRIRRSR